MSWVEKNLSKYWKFYIPIALFTLLVLTYFRVPFIFFIQDEWFAFGLMNASGLDLVFQRFKAGDVNHFVPLNSFIGYQLFNLFKFNYLYYNLAGLSIHFINSLLIFLLARELLKKRLYSFIVSVIFLSSSSAAELVMWPLVSLNTLSLSFTLLAWLFVTKYNKWKHPFLLGIIVSVFMILSLLIIEYAAGLFIFVPTTILMYTRKGGIKRAILFLIPFVLLSILYLLFRFLPFIGVSEIISKSGGGNYFTILSKLLGLLILYIGQLTLPELAFSFLLESLKTNLQIFQVIIYLVSITTMFTIFLILRSKVTLLAKNLLLILIFILSSIFPYSFILDSSSYYFAGRYIYFGLAGSSLLIGLISYLLFSLNKKKFKALSLSIILIYVLSGIYGNWRKEEGLFIQGNVRKKILNDIKNKYPILPSRVVFLTESDSSYYGLPGEEKILPFQSGFGQALLVWYYPTQKFPKQLFQDRFLWEIREQGYREFENRGFGYFRDISLLKKTIKDNNIPIDSVISYSWNSQSQTLLDISEQIRRELLKDS